MLRCLSICLLLSITPAVNAQAPQRLFYSGHSLLDEPLPRDVALIAASLGTPLARHTVHTPPGSSIRERGTGAPSFEGHDALLVTEQHTLIGNIVWNDSVGELRSLLQRFTAANPGARVWFYAPWLSLDDRARPQRWIAYERAAAPLWRCVAVQAAAGAPRRIEWLPANALLADLVERVQQGHIGGVTVTSLFRDEVHLSALGSYFMSAVVYASLFERSPVGAAVPAGIDANAARALQAAAWELVQQDRQQQREPPRLETCRQRLRDFVTPYAAYVRDAIDRPREGAWRAWWLWAKHRVLWWRALRD